MPRNRTTPAAPSTTAIPHMEAKFETIAQVQALLQPFIAPDPRLATVEIPNYVVDIPTGERFRSLAAKELGRALAIWSNMTPETLYEDPNDPKRLYILTRDPVVGTSTHVVVRHTNGQPWGIFGVRKAGGNHERLTQPAFVRWANVYEPEYNADGSPRNLAAMNAENAKNLPNYRARHADITCEKHLLTALLSTDGTTLSLPMAHGETPDYVWNAIALGYEAEVASWDTVREVVVRPA